jgi:alpha-glucuronidase
MIRVWESLRSEIDHQRHEYVSKRLKMQLENALHWREVCLKYFGQFAKH